MMSKRFKRILALFLTLIFLIVAPIVVLYAVGFRLIKTKNITGIEVTSGIKINTKNTYDVYIDNEMVGKTPFLKIGVPSGQRQVQLKKLGYHDWTKRLSLEHYIVSKIETALLFPKDPVRLPIIKDKLVSQIIPIPEKSSFLYTSQEPTQNGIWLYNSDTNTDIQLVKNTDFKGSALQSYDNITWNQDNQTLLFKSSIEDQPRYFVLSNALSTNPSLEDITTLLPYPVITTPVLFTSLEGNKVSLLQGGHIFNIDILKKQLSPSIVSDVQTATVKDTTYYYSEQNTNNIIKYNTLNKTKSIIAQGIQNVKKVIVSPGDVIFLVYNDNTIAILEKTTDSNYIKANSLDNIKGTNIILSPRGDKALIVDSHTISIYYTDNIESYVDRKKGITSTLYSNSSKEITAQQFLNVDYDHISFLENGILKIVELDDRDKPNVVDLGIADQYVITGDGSSLDYFLVKDGVINTFSMELQKNSIF